MNVVRIDVVWFLYIFVWVLSGVGVISPFFLSIVSMAGVLSCHCYGLIISSLRVCYTA